MTCVSLKTIMNSQVVFWQVEMSVCLVLNHNALIPDWMSSAHNLWFWYQTDAHPYWQMLKAVCPFSLSYTQIPNLAMIFPNARAYLSLN